MFGQRITGVLRGFHLWPHCLQTHSGILMSWGLAWLFMDGRWCLMSSL